MHLSLVMFFCIIKSVVYFVGGRCGGLMVSELIPRLSDPALSPGRGHGAVCWAGHFTLTVPLSTQVY